MGHGLTAAATSTREQSRLDIIFSNALKQSESISIIKIEQNFKQNNYRFQIRAAINPSILDITDLGRKLQNCQFSDINVSAL